MYGDDGSELVVGRSLTVLSVFEGDAMMSLRAKFAWGFRLGPSWGSVQWGAVNHALRLKMWFKLLDVFLVIEGRAQCHICGSA